VTLNESRLYSPCPPPVLRDGEGGRAESAVAAAQLRAGRRLCGVCCDRKAAATTPERVTPSGFKSLAGLRSAANRG